MALAPAPYIFFLIWRSGRKNRVKRGVIWLFSLLRVGARFCESLPPPIVSSKLRPCISGTWRNPNFSEFSVFCLCWRIRALTDVDEPPKCLSCVNCSNYVRHGKFLSLLERDQVLASNQTVISLLDQRGGT